MSLGIAHASGSILKHLLKILDARAEIISLETHLEKRRVSRLVIFGCLAAGSTLMALVFGGMLALILSPEENRAIVAGVISLIFAVCASILFVLIYRSLTHQPAPYEISRIELKKDIECLNVIIRSKD